MPGAIVTNWMPTYMKHQLPAVERVIGEGGTLAAGATADGGIELTVASIKGALSQLGYSKITAVRH